MKVANNTPIQDAVNAYYPDRRLYDNGALFLQSKGIVVVGDLKRIYWRSVIADVLPLGSYEWLAILALVDWMAYTNRSFKDLRPAQAFPTILERGQFGTSIDNALLRLNITRLEMLCLFTELELNQARRGWFGPERLAILKKALSAKNISFRK